MPCLGPEVIVVFVWAYFAAIWSRRKWLTAFVGGNSGQDFCATEATPAENTKQT